MGKKLIISYNYGANVVILIGFVFLFVISYENILTLIVGLILLAIFLFLSIKKTLILRLMIPVFS